MRDFYDFSRMNGSIAFRIFHIVALKIDQHDVDIIAHTRRSWCCLKVLSWTLRLPTRNARVVFLLCIIKWVKSSGSHWIPNYISFPCIATFLLQLLSFTSTLCLSDDNHPEIFSQVPTTNMFLEKVTCTSLAPFYWPPFTSQFSGCLLKPLALFSQNN